MYAYGAKTGTEKIMLLYPDDGDTTYLNWQMEYDNGRKIDLLIRSITLSIDLMKDWNQFLEQITFFLREVCPKNLMVPTKPSEFRESLKEWPHAHQV